MRRTIVTTLALCLALLLMGGCGKKADRNDTKPAASKSGWTAGLSADQARVAEEFGEPDMFGVVFGADLEGIIDAPEAPAQRLEWWDYADYRTRFVFREGAFVRSQVIADPSESIEDDVYYVSATPTDFDEGMSPAEVSEVLGGEPLVETTFKPAALKGLTAFDWGGVATAVFSEDGLVGITTGAAAEWVSP